MRKRYNTPHRSHVVKSRLSDEEYADFTGRLAPYNISQAEFIRQAIQRATIRPVITVSPVNDELLAAVGKLTAEYGRIGGNLNQIARSLNEYGAPYAARYFKAHGITKLPASKTLQREIEQLTVQKNAGYNDYREKRERVRQLQTVKSNIDRILRRDEPKHRKEQAHDL